MDIAEDFGKWMIEEEERIKNYVYTPPVKIDKRIKPKKPIQMGLFARNISSSFTP